MVKETVIFALTSSTDLAAHVCRDLGLPLGKIKVEHFADGEILVEPQESVRGRSVFIVQSTCNPVTERLMEVLVCIDACKRASAGEINVIMPYYGYARQDRKAKPRQPITAKLVADLLQVAGADRVVVFDLHATQIQGFFDIPIDDLTAVPMLGQYFKEKNLPSDKLVVVSPDHGGVTRARRLADILDAPIAIIDKRRPKPNMVEAQNVIGDVNGKICIVVDDICDTAGSLVAGCQILKDHGASEIYTGITHGVFSRDAIEKIENSPIKEMVITDTIPMSEEQKARTTKIHVLSVADMIARTIDSIQNHTPVSDVYDLFKD
ncbi:MAG: ribose-phosphate pyrophosphokinase [Erysipelotrichaceae bacterium]|jgi:ribose-phosphate pyrophosphokinase|uniref:ribose-phosphate diphosphokinase n=1 Tax=Lactimicrobium massiliense TaxID=2161814 RepID=UPI000D55CF85|nr:ribose-phosphate pyrophosphokinase [Lactimicrobium massiliense]MCH4021420.1 ribose-phosphate pyrophosphokinase [Erysipelotrichaceae bacterium]MCI1325867.1 ribose-phosphate pyrophosphokinase [Solobacterium sp.]MCH4043579.1 ribose-phosphate pyrophosphokinase [Erysipelotrichaceae bacterium]MCH4120799.1 ribose-phosphate pyrophosphokinase [Erysipelotrichaceae bacterium]MCI1363604.1 ribose-phosphate pyrophosphokinase [Solobacterium sp.]